MWSSWGEDIGYTMHSVEQLGRGRELNDAQCGGAGDEGDDVDHRLVQNQNVN